MKNLYLYILIILSLVLFENKAYAAYCNTPASTVAITPTGTAQNTPTYTSGRRAFTFNATAGCTYSFSTCGNTSVDTYLRLYSGNGGTLLFSADDQCGAQSSISWTCPTTGAYSILLTRYSCNNLNGAAYMTYSVSCPASCTENSITLNMNDSWGDGWNGGSITLTNNSGGSYGPYSITGSAGSQSLCLPDDCYSINMVPGTYPGEITWSLSNGVSGNGSYGNQSNVFTLGSGSCGTPPPPPCASNDVNLNITAGAYPGEVSWTLVDPSGTTVATGGAPYNENLCLPTGCYTFNMVDSWGDGWNGANYTFTLGGSSIGTGTLGTGASGSAQIGIGTSCGPPPDPCAAAINIPSLPVNNQSVVCSSSDNLNSSNVPACGGASTLYLGGNEALYTITPSTSGPYTISYNGVTYSSIWVWANACPASGGTCVGSVSSSASAQTLNVNFTAGVTYYVMFDTWPSPVSPCPGTFSITAPVPPPANDLVCSATAITCGATLSGTTVNATNSGTGEGGTCGTAQTQPGVWYVVAGNGQVMTASLCGTAWDSKMSVFSGTNCSTLTCIGGNDDNGPACGGSSASYSWSSVTGTNYYILVHGYSSTSAFNIALSCVTPTPPPANDDCANAQSIAIQCPAAATAVSGTTANATEEAIADPSCDAGTIQDVWYTFNSGNNSSVDLSVTLGTASWLGGEIHTTCGTPAPGLTIGGNPGNCDFYLLNPAPTNISGLTPNTDYRLRLFNNVDWDIAGTFTFTLTYTGNSTAVAPSSISGTNAVCFGQNTTLTLQGGSPGINGVAQWFAGSCGSTVIGTGNSITVSPTANTTYFVRYAGTCITTPCVSSTVTLPTPSNSLSGDGVAATCTVNQNGFIHLLASNGDLVASINSNGQNLGTVTATSYIEGSPLLVEDCNAPGNTTVMTSVMDRHWVITTQFPPSAPVNVLMPFTEGEFSSLNFAAFNNANPNDEVPNYTEVGSTKYSGPNEDDLFPNNCVSNGGSGNVTWHSQTSNGQVNTYLASHPGTNRFITINVNSFSEFWLHGSSNSTPLPVELISFQANCTDDNKVDVTWTTASENNSMHFVVETSKDVVNWEVLSIVPAAHFSTSTLNYTISHEGATREKNYYRLKQVDQDGAFEYYNMIYANCGNVRGNPVTFPNPSKDNFTIDFNGSDMSGEVQLSLMNMEGKEISNRQLNLEKGVNTIQINTVELQPGIYYIKLFDLTGRVFIIKHCFM